MDLGYARVSTREQDLTGQVAELRAAGCAKIYSEKASGARCDRAELARVIKRLQPGDVLVVTRLDRLASSTRDLLNVLEAVKQAGAGFRSLKAAWCDITMPRKRHPRPRAFGPWPVNQTVLAGRAPGRLSVREV